MQTSQVSNPANVIASPTSSGKPSDAGSSSAPFGQVLSREVSNRNASEGARPQAREAGNTGNANAARQTAKNDSKPADAKAAKEARKQDDSAEGTVENAADPAVQASEDILALVADISQMTAPAVEATDAAAAVPVVAAEAATATDAALAMMATGAVQPQGPLSTTPAVTADGPALAQPAARTAPDVSLAAISAAGRNGNAATQLETVTAAKGELPQAATANQLAKGPEVMNSVAAAATAGTPAAKDFSAAMQESVNTIAATMTPVQQVALQAAQSMAPNLAERLTPRVGTPAWDQALGQKVVWMVAGEQQSASLTLNPPDLGPLQVVLNVSNSQANATFIAAQPEVRQALEQALPKLREMLGEAGIQLGQASVNSGNPNQQGGFEQQASGSSNGNGLGRADNRGEGNSTESQRVTRVRPASVGQGMVDTFA